MEVIRIIVDVARRTPKTPPEEGVHAACTVWASNFLDLLRLALKEAGYSKGLKDAAEGGVLIGGTEFEIWDVPPMSTHNTHLFGMGRVLPLGIGSCFFWQFHTIVPFKLKDGSIIYVDVGVLSTGDVTTGDNASSPFSVNPPPSDWLAPGVRADREKKLDDYWSGKNNSGKPAPDYKMPEPHGLGPY